MIHGCRTSINDWFERYVNRYRNADSALPAALEMKYHHSRRVADNPRLISEF
ncbi:MAG: hypothetical protein JW925_04060 [Syntrophaceae bacterium]|nr:hypothetical protein [Syntrophaceae bacterium]